MAQADKLKAEGFNGKGFQRPGYPWSTDKLGSSQSSTGDFVDSYSNWGPTFGGELRRSAPPWGTSCLRTFCSKADTPSNSGTSLSTPMVGAIIALVFNARGKTTPAEITYLLPSTAKPSF
ncbi:hypothetical protein CSHISOI_02470 [Colletotrichum shisoi]|uniref:Peptidase S8/S53 domain-containing protein n=1 Tax=Colletotrichum shisoi TaxID=2078593 RepID=A0A5Q4C0U2_9PEZI|nr:hypothetical protein CSHISOI_02470 [Colletotrichum shisoi]